MTADPISILSRIKVSFIEQNTLIQSKTFKEAYEKTGEIN